jgi:hypothetical protein
LRKKGAVGGSKIAVGVYLNLRDRMKNRYNIRGASVDAHHTKV